MKKYNLRPIIWSALIMASLSSYIYLHAAAVEEFGSCPSAIQHSNESLEKEQRETKIFLPDIALVKKIINITKIVMPKD